VPDVQNIEYKLQLISDSAQPDQRTQQWYEFRHSLITASSAWKVFDSQAVLNSLIYEKCSPCRINDQGNGYVNTESPLHWGHKYEPLSILLYESKYKTEIGEYGCILHKQYGFLGASPDGINIQKSNERFGRMLEIKNIVNREITKIPKKEYWIQMQLQMEVCDLNECDFLETRFKEYQSFEEYIQDGTPNLSQDGKLKGVILLFYDENKPLYEYYVKDINGKYDVWEKKQFNVHKNHLFMKSIYWKLDEFSCILVLRNKKWFHSAVVEMEKISLVIKHEKLHGYDHRAPKKRERKLSFDMTKNKCHINLSSKSVDKIQFNFSDD
jgi:putative phage-type endonuclease